MNKLGENCFSERGLVPGPSQGSAVSLIVLVRDIIISSFYLK